MATWEKPNEDDGWSKKIEKKTRAHNLSQKEALQILNWISNAFVRRIWAKDKKKTSRFDKTTRHTKKKMKQKREEMAHKH